MELWMRQTVPRDQKWWDICSIWLYSINSIPANVLAAFAAWATAGMILTLNILLDIYTDFCYWLIRTINMSGCDTICLSWGYWMRQFEFLWDYVSISRPGINMWYINLLKWNAMSTGNTMHMIYYVVVFYRSTAYFLQFE